MNEYGDFTEYDRVMRDMRQLINEGEDYFGDKVETVNEIVDGFEKLGYDMALHLKMYLNEAFEELRHHDEMEYQRIVASPIRSQRPSSLPSLPINSESSDDDDVFIVDPPPATSPRRTNVGSSRGRPLTISPSPPPTIPARPAAPVSPASPAPTRIRAPTRPAPSVGESSRRDPSGHNLNPPKRPRVVPRRANINAGWMQTNMTQSANDSFSDYGLYPSRLHKNVKERYALVLEILERHKQQAANNGAATNNNEVVDKIIRVEAVPKELRSMVVCSVDAGAKKMIEHYNAYMVALTIDQMVEDLSNESDTPISKARQVEHIYSLVARSFRNTNEGYAYCRYCKRAQIMANVVGIYILVLYEVISKDFLLKKIKTEADAMHIANVADMGHIPRQVIEAKVVDGVLVMDDLEN